MQITTQHYFHIFQNHLKDDAEKNFTVYSQFISICTSMESTSFDYGVRIDDTSLGFDVYFVTSVIERYNYHYNPEEFWFYPECSGLTIRV